MWHLKCHIVYHWIVRFHQVDRFLTQPRKYQMSGAYGKGYAVTTITPCFTEIHSRIWLVMKAINKWQNSRGFFFFIIERFVIDNNTVNNLRLFESVTIFFTEIVHIHVYSHTRTVYRWKRSHSTLSKNNQSFAAGMHKMHYYHYYCYYY